MVGWRLVPGRFGMGLGFVWEVWDQLWDDLGSIQHRFGYVWSEVGTDLCLPFDDLDLCIVSSLTKWISLFLKFGRSSRSNTRTCCKTDTSNEIIYKLFRNA